MVHSNQSGVSHFLAKDDRECLAKVREGIKALNVVLDTGATQEAAQPNLAEVVEKKLFNNSESGLMKMLTFSISLIFLS